MVSASLVLLSCCRAGRGMDGHNGQKTTDGVFGEMEMERARPRLQGRKNSKPRCTAFHPCGHGTWEIWADGTWSMDRVGYCMGHGTWAADGPWQLCACVRWVWVSPSPVPCAWSCGCPCVSVQTCQGVSDWRVMSILSSLVGEFGGGRSSGAIRRKGAALPQCSNGRVVARSLLPGVCPWWWKKEGGRYLDQWIR